jgi:hypothetical protein
LYRWSAAAIVFSLLFSGGYVLWRVSTGYREHRDALANFGKAVREQASMHGWRYGVVASPDEGMLLYLRKTRFVLPQRAIADWNAGELDALTVSSADEPDVAPQLNPKGIYVLRSVHRPDPGALDYVLITKPRP